MPDLPSRLDYYALGRQYVIQKAQKIDPAMVDVAGSDVNLVVGTGSVLADAVTKQLGYAISRIFLDGCFDEDLDRYVWDRYQLLRKGASQATGVVRLYRDTSAIGAGTILAGTKLLTLGGFEYVTTQPASFGAGTLDNVLVNVAAVQAGKATQVGANTIRRFANTSALFDQTIQCNNDLTTGGGQDVEDDDTLKARVRTFWTTQQRGTLAAIQFGALTVPGVVSASAIEAVTPNGPFAARLVNLYIADSSGVASAPLAAQVFVALNNYRAAGIPVVVFSSIPFIQQIVLHLAFQTGVDTVTLGNQIQAAVTSFVNNLPVNGTLYFAQLGSVLQRYVADGLIPNQSAITSPSFDVVPPVGQTIRTTTSNVLLT
jgi:uncharacterized phage protein gp47/JayE